MMLYMYIKMALDLFRLGNGSICDIDKVFLTKRTAKVFLVEEKPSLYHDKVFLVTAINRQEEPLLYPRQTPPQLYNNDRTVKRAEGL